jgi:hypothetical protein
MAAKAVWCRTGTALLLGLFVAASSRSAEKPSARLLLDAGAPEVGSVFSLTLEVRAPRNTVVQLPGASAPLQPFELLAYSSSEAAEGEETVVRGHYRLMAVLGGKFELGPLRVGLKLADGADSELLAEPIAFDVRSVVAALQPRPKDLLSIKAPLPPPESGGRRWGWFLIPGGLALGIVLAGLGWLRWHRKKLGPPPEAAHVAALRRLQELSRRELDTPDSVEPFYVGLSEILRRFLESRFGAPVMEQTTLEIKRQFDPAVHGPNWTFRLYQLLERMDLVKFARFRIGASAAFEDLEAARTLIEEVVDRDTKAEAERDRREKLSVSAGTGGVDQPGA